MLPPLTFQPLPKKEIVEPLFTTLREKIPTDELEAALKRGKVMGLDTVVQALLEEITLTEGSTDAG